MVKAFASQTAGFTCSPVLFGVLRAAVGGKAPGTRRSQMPFFKQRKKEHPKMFLEIAETWSKHLLRKQQLCCCPVLFGVLRAAVGGKAHAGTGARVQFFQINKKEIILR